MIMADGGMGVAIEPAGNITDIRKFSTHDGPGIRTTVFFKGCPLKCKWCANPETIKSYQELYFIAKRCHRYGACMEACPEKAIGLKNQVKIDRVRCSRCMQCVEACPHGAFKTIGKRVRVSEVIRECEKDIPFYQQNGGVTISGGEPLYQPDFALALLTACKERKLSTVLDTSAYSNPSVVETLLPLTDLVLLDIKHMDPVRHAEGTGVTNQVILQNARLMAGKVNIRVSLPLIPGFNNSEENLEQTAVFAKSLGVKSVDINPLHTLGAFKYQYLGLPSPYAAYPKVTGKDIKKAQSIFQCYGLSSTIGRMM